MIKDLITRIFAKTVDYPQHTDRCEIGGKSKLYPARRFYREDLGIEFKSSMEANYARMLNYLGVKWQYEPQILYYPSKDSLASKATGYKNTHKNPLDILGYCPDFKITVGKHFYYVETKGYMDRMSIEKIRLFKTFYPYFKLYIVTPKEYRLITKLYANKIRNWEK